jgi:DNA-binding XRE family transcriptional regulator
VKGLEQKELAKKIGVHKLSVYNRENDRKKAFRKSTGIIAKFFRPGRETWEDMRTVRKKSV